MPLISQYLKILIALMLGQSRDRQNESNSGSGPDRSFSGPDPVKSGFLGVRRGFSGPDPEKPGYFGVYRDRAVFLERNPDKPRSGPDPVRSLSESLNNSTKNI